MFESLKNALVPMAAPAPHVREEPRLGGSQLTEIRNDTVAFSITDLDRMLEMFQIKPAASGMAVNSRTATRVAAVYACVRLIAGAIATLPLKVYRNTDDVPEKAPNHPLNWLLNAQPTPLCSASMFWDYIIGCKLLRGDGLAAIVRNAAAEIVELIPLDPDLSRIERRGNRLVYFVQLVSDDGAPEYIGLDQDDVLHLPGFGWDLNRLGSPILRGMSVISHAAHQAVGNALAMDEYSGKFFANGATPSIVLEAPGKMDDAQVKRLRELWEQKYSGVQNAHRPLILTEGLKANPLSISAEDSQLIEARNFEVIDIARAFGIPPHMIGAMDKTSAWGTGIEHLSIAFVNYSLQTHLTQIVQEINRKSFRVSRYFVEFSVEALLRGDAATQAKVFRESLGGAQGPGWMTPNEVRRLKNLPPIAGGDKLYIPPPKSTTKPGDNNEPVTE